MTHFALENELNSLVSIDDTDNRGSQMRWQRRASESCNMNRTKNESTVSCSVSNNVGPHITGKTPMKEHNKTPSNTPSKHKRPITPGKLTPGKRTPSHSGDRFIPNRSATKFELGHYLMSNNKLVDESEATLSPSKKEFQKIMNENLNGDLMESKIIAYKSKAPCAPEDLNLLDWSANNHLAVCLGGHVYLWNASSGDIQQLMETASPDDYVTSVAWICQGNHLAIGTSDGCVQLWDVDQQKEIRCMAGHAARVGALSWNSYILSSGSRSGSIHHHDVRVADHHVGTLNSHTQEVCGLKWSPDGKYLASGGNDNLLNIWPVVQGQRYTETVPLYTFSQHQAAVKALAWCPWQAGLLASGGGTADRHIRFWNCHTGACVNAVDTKSQVCAILWSKEYKELVSSHGFAHNQLVIWKYPTLDKVAELTGHTQRVLHMAMSPDGSTVASAAADETLRLWKCFLADPNKKKQGKETSAKKASSILKQNIR